MMGPPVTVVAALHPRGERQVAVGGSGASSTVITTDAALGEAREGSPHTPTSTSTVANVGLIERGVVEPVARHAALELLVPLLEHLGRLGLLAEALEVDLLGEAVVVGLLGHPGPGDPEQRRLGPDAPLVEELEDVGRRRGLVGVQDADADEADVVAVAGVGDDGPGAALHEEELRPGVGRVGLLMELDVRQPVDEGVVLLGRAGGSDEGGIGSIGIVLVILELPQKLHGIHRLLDGTAGLGPFGHQFGAPLARPDEALELPQPLVVGPAGVVIDRRGRRQRFGQRRGVPTAGQRGGVLLPQLPFRLLLGRSRRSHSDTCAIGCADCFRLQADTTRYQYE